IEDDDDRRAARVFGIPRKFFGQDLDRNLTLQFRFACAIHLTHSALAEQGDDLVRAKLHTDRDGPRTARDYSRLLSDPCRYPTLSSGEGNDSRRTIRAY